MKRILFVIAFALFHHGVSAQLYLAEGSRVLDMSSKSTRMEKFVWDIDSNELSLQSGEKKYYYSVTSFQLLESVINIKALDLNDEEVMIRFSPQQKMLEYYLREFGLRYYFDKVTKPKPEDSMAAPPDSAVELSDSAVAAEHMRLDTMVYDEADPMPEFPGGKTELMSFISKNVRYPAKAKKEGIKGFVQVNAIVEKDGTIKYAEARKDPGGGLGDEAIRLVKSMPPWNPGYKDGDAVRCLTTITVGFMPK